MTTKKIRHNSTPPYLSKFLAYQRNEKHCTEATVKNMQARLMVVHNYFMRSPSFRQRCNGQWQKTSRCPIPYVVYKEMKAFFNEMYELKSANTRKAYRSAIKRFCIYAEVNLGIKSPMTPAEWAEIEPGRKNKTDRNKTIPVLTPSIIDSIIQKAHNVQPTVINIRNILILRTLIATGGRISEIMYLKRKYVYLKEDTPIIALCNKKTIQRRYKIREIPIDRTLYNDLRDFFTVWNEEYGVSQFAFPHQNNSPVPKHAIRGFINRIAKQLDLHLTPHLFRHYRASRWCEHAISQADIGRVAKWMGDTVATVRNVYLGVE